MKLPNTIYLTRSSCIGILLILFSLLSWQAAYSQTDTRTVDAGQFKVGEKLSYNVSFEKFQNVAVIETQVVSVGKLRGQDAVELRGHAKTFELVSAAFRLIDETRTTYVSPLTGMPIFVDRTVNEGPLPKRISVDNVESPPTGYDLLSLMYRIRQSGGNGSFTLTEDGETHIVTAQAGKSQRVRTQAGTYDTTIVEITSSYLDGLGIRSMSINLSVDGDNLPVVITFRTQRGVYRAELANVQTDTPSTLPTPTPAVVVTPVPTATPISQPTPVPYVDNQPLLPELSFELGESLEYRLTNGGQPAGTVRFQASERKQFQGKDSLKLEFSASNVTGGNNAFMLGDNAYAQVDPETLAPLLFEMNFKGPLNSFNQRVFFDQKAGRISFAGARSVEAPIGTHCILSLFYAMRSFNLKPSKDPTNPVNDTRVAVFWEDQPYIFTLRPGAAEDIMISNEKVSAQLISINTGSRSLDNLAIRVWLSTDARRLPIRISVGSYQAELVTVSKTLP